jgi:hypothetical protein
LTWGSGRNITLYEENAAMPTGPNREAARLICGASPQVAVNLLMLGAAIGAVATTAAFLFLGLVQTG